MQRLRFSWLIPCSAVLLIAAEPVWNDKPIASWTDEDAKQILTHSPWARTVVAGITRRQTEDERREGGNMGQPQGVGYDGLDHRQPRPVAPGNLLPEPRAVSAVQNQGLPLLVRWESALPIRAAELKAHVPDPPTLSDGGYSIAVYGVPSSFAKGDPTSLGKPLKELAFLRRDGKRDVKPVSVEVFELEDSVAVVYLFPLSAEIGKKDSIVEFGAMIGRIRVSQHFNLEEMLFQGKLGL
jgi:hypothetical protein